MNSKSKILNGSIFLVSLLLVIAAFIPADRPTLYIIGDSTVQNNDGNGRIPTDWPSVTMQNLEPQMVLFV